MATPSRIDHEFTLTLGGFPKAGTKAAFREIAEILIVGTMHDAAPTLRDGRIYVNFCRKAATIRAAVSSALRDVERLGLTTVNIEIHIIHD
ncbi:hypothetical protein EP7_003556 [Isosphaeraceae bacterium EP7]